MSFSRVMVSVVMATRAAGPAARKAGRWRRVRPPGRREVLLRSAARHDVGLAVAGDALVVVAGPIEAVAGGGDGVGGSLGCQLLGKSSKAVLIWPAWVQRMARAAFDHDEPHVVDQAGQPLTGLVDRQDLVGVA
jgi:hypothetical protein